MKCYLVVISTNDTIGDSEEKDINEILKTIEF